MSPAPSGLSRLFTDITSLIYYQIGMSSACINPILYGYLNETFRKEFTAIAGPLKSCLENKVPACLKSKSNQEAEPEQALEIQPLEVKVQNGSSKVENKLIPRDPTSFNDKKMDLITVHNAKSWIIWREFWRPSKKPSKAQGPWTVYYKKSFFKCVKNIN